MTKHSFKYQYLVREFAFRVLKRLPLPIKNFGVGLFVKGRKEWLEKLKTPAQIILYVTNRCNARCFHCFYWREIAQGVKKELSLGQIEEIAKTLANPLTTLSITGGEPFLRDDLVQICQAFFELNGTQKINIVTNGFFTKKIKETTKKILEKCPVDLNIQISLDGLQKTHDEIRRIPVFKKAFETIEVLDKLSSQFKNFHITVQTTVFKQNLDELVPLGKFIKKKFPSVHHGFQFVRSASFDVYQIDKKILSNLDPRVKEPLLSVREMEEAFKKFSQFSGSNNSLLSFYVKVMNKGIISMKKKKQSFVKCLAGKYDAVIWPDGGVSMCEFTKPFANLKHFNFNFSDLWKSKEANEMRKKIRACFCTHTCNLLNAMQFDKKVLMDILANGESNWN